MRYVYLSIGFVCVLVGFIGIVVPGIPTTPLILVAAWAFARSSKRFELWLLRHRVFGRLITDWRNHRGISRKSKITAVFLIVPTFSTTIFFAFPFVFDLVFIIFGVSLCIYLVTRPEPPIRAIGDEG